MQSIARVLKSHGKDGGILLGFTTVSPEDIDLQEPVFIYFDGLPVPFYFEDFTPKGTSRAIARITGVRSLADADEIAGAEVFADYFEEEDELAFLEGMTLKDADGSLIGTVSAYEDIPGNLCLWVETPKGEVLVPFHQDLIVSIDEKTGTLIMNIPDGLL